MALGSCLNAGHTPTHTWRLSLASMLGTPLSTRDILLPTWGLGIPQCSRGAWARQDPTIIGPYMLQTKNSLGSCQCQDPTF